jgi:hypothetical protein
LRTLKARGVSPTCMGPRPPAVHSGRVRHQARFFGWPRACQVFVSIFGKPGLCSSERPRNRTRDITWLQVTSLTPARWNHPALHRHEWSASCHHPTTTLLGCRDGQIKQHAIFP